MQAPIKKLLNSYTPYTKRKTPNLLNSLEKMKKQRWIELAVKVVVAALTAFLTALGTTSCMGVGPF